MLSVAASNIALPHNARHHRMRACKLQLKIRHQPHSGACDCYASQLLVFDDVWIVRFGQRRNVNARSQQMVRGRIGGSHDCRATRTRLVDLADPFLTAPNLTAVAVAASGCGVFYYPVELSLEQNWAMNSEGFVLDLRQQRVPAIG